MRRIIGVLAVAGVVLGLQQIAEAQTTLLAIGADYNLYDVNPSTAALTNPRNVATYCGLAATASGTLYGFDCTNQILATINQNTGAATVIPGGQTGFNIEGDLAVDPTSGLLYSVDGGSGTLSIISPQNSAATVIGHITTSGANMDLSAMAFDSTGRLYVYDGFATPSPTIDEVDKNTAAIVRSIVLNPPAGGTIAGMAFSPTNGKLYLALSALYTVDLSTGAVTLIGNFPTNLGGTFALTFSPPPLETGSPCSNCLRPPDGMTAWLPLDESLLTAPLINIFGPAGTRTGGTAAPGVVAGSACMNGSNGYVTIPSYVLFTNAFSIDAWIVRHSLTAGGTIFDKRTGAGTSNDRGVRFYLQPNGTLGLEMGNGGSPVNFVSPTTAAVVLPDGVFHHVAVTVTRGSLTGGRYYLDGALIHTFPTILPFGGGLLNASPSRIGADSQSAANVFNGCIDELEVFARTLDAREVTAMCDTGSNGKCRMFGVSPLATALCKTVTTQQHHKVCNASLIPQTFTYSFTALPPLGSCNQAGPVNFVPWSGGPVTVPAGQCVDVPVTVTVNPWPQVPSESCYQLTITGSWGTVQTTGMLTNGCSDNTK